MDAWEKASNARIVADRAVEKLKSLRVKANATQEQIDAAKKKVASRKIKATKLEIAANFADDDAQAAAQQMASPIHEPTPVHETAQVDRGTPVDEAAPLTGNSEDCFNKGTDRESKTPLAPSITATSTNSIGQIWKQLAR